MHDAGDGSYEVQFTATRAGELELNMMLGQQVCHAFKVHVLPAPAEPSACRLEHFSVAPTFIAGEPFYLALVCFDRFKNVTTVDAAECTVRLVPYGASARASTGAAATADDSSAILLVVTDVARISAVVPKAGRYRIVGELRGVPIGDSRASGQRTALIDVAAACAPSERSA